jgi:hypothetical protein
MLAGNLTAAFVKFGYIYFADIQIIQADGGSGYIYDGVGSAYFMKVNFLMGLAVGFGFCLGDDEKDSFGYCFGIVCDGGSINYGINILKIPVFVMTVVQMGCGN